MSRHSLLIALPLIAAVLSARDPAEGGVTVVLVDGARLTADRMTAGPSGDLVDLHLKRDGIALVRHLRRGDVREVHIEGRVYPADRLSLLVPANDAPLPSASIASARAFGANHSQYSVLRTQYSESEGDELAPPPAVSSQSQRPPHSADEEPAADEPRDNAPPDFLLAPPPTPVAPIAPKAPVLIEPALAPGQSIPGLACGPQLLWPDARVIGVRDDPLSAYVDTLACTFPHGVPVSETGFALHLMRARKVQDVLGAGAPMPPHGVGPAPPPLPAPTLPLDRLEATAFALNASGKADWDALAIDLRGLDLLDRPAALRGTVRITLRGQSQQLARVHTNRFIAVPGSIEPVGTWHRTIDQPVAAVRLVLPLPRPLPDHDPDRFPFGWVSVQLLVPGAGVFEATVPQVLLSQIDPHRELNRIETGSRFFADEATSDSPVTGGRPSAGVRRP